jgi:hypothetical protein
MISKTIIINLNSTNLINGYKGSIVNTSLEEDPNEEKLPRKTR